MLGVPLLYLWLFSGLLFGNLIFSKSMTAESYENQNILLNVKNLTYINQDTNDEYRKQMCKLDVYYPANKKDFITIVWIHGGFLKFGNKEMIPPLLLNKGYGIVSMNYRLSPKAQHPSYIDDVAAAVAWTFKHIEQYGGNRKKIFISGHSAGGYLSLMLALEKKYLSAYGIDAESVVAYLPISGQTSTHSAIREEKGMPEDIPYVDEYAPLNRIRNNTSPIVLITGDRYLEMANRWEENAFLYSALKSIGNKQVNLYEMQGFNHMTIPEPASSLISNYIDNLYSNKTATSIIKI